MENPILDPDMEEINAYAEEASQEFTHEGIVEAVSEELGTIEEAIRNPNLSDSEISEYEQQAIDDFGRESTGELIEQELQNTNYSKELIEKLKETGIEELEPHLPTKKVHTPKEQNSYKPPKTTGSEGSPRPHNYPNEARKQNDPPLPRGDKSAYEPTKRERLEATKEGLTEYLENETRRPSNDPDVIKHRESEEEKTLEQLEKIEEQLQVLPPDPEEEIIEIGDVSDEEARDEGWRDNHERKHWKEGTLAHNEFITKHSKQQKLDGIKSKLSVGVTNEDLGECANAIRKSVARELLPPHMLPENMTEQYDFEELKEEIRQAQEKPEKDPEDEDSEIDTEEEFSYEEGTEH